MSTYAVYTPYPAPPVDIVDPYKSWTLAAIYARCYYYYPPGLERWLVVEEYSKRGRVTITDPHCGPGGMASGSTAPAYGAYEPIPTDPGTSYAADCGGPGNGEIGGGGEGEDICIYQNLAPGCYDVYVDGAYRGTVCC